MVVEQVESGRSKKGPGRFLRLAREEANLSLEDVSAHLRISTSILTEIEEDNYSNLMFTFVRGYLRSYARLLSLSPDDIISTFNAMEIEEIAKPKAVVLPAAQKGAKIRTRDQRVSPEKIARWSGLVVVLTLVVLVGFWWHNQGISQPLPPQTGATGAPIQTTVLPSNEPPADGSTKIQSIMLPSQPPADTLTDNTSSNNASASSAPMPPSNAGTSSSKSVTTALLTNPPAVAASNGAVTMVPSPSSLVDGDNNTAAAAQPASTQPTIVPLNLNNSTSQSNSGTTTKSKSSNKKSAQLVEPFTAN